MWIASGLATTIALLIGLTSRSWAQSARSADATSSAPAAPGSTASTLLALGVVALIVILIVAARDVAARRRQIEHAVVLQSQLADRLAREAQLQELRITPKARVSGWRGAQVTIDVAGQVPTPDLRETVIQIVSTEAWRLRPGVIIVDHLWVNPSARPASRTPRR